VDSNKEQQCQVEETQMDLYQDQQIQKQNKIMVEEINQQQNKGKWNQENDEEEKEKNENKKFKKNNTIGNDKNEKVITTNVQ